VFDSFASAAGTGSTLALSLATAKFRRGITDHDTNASPNARHGAGSPPIPPPCTSARTATATATTATSTHQTTTTQLCSRRTFILGYRQEGMVLRASSHWLPNNTTATTATPSLQVTTATPTASARGCPTTTASAATDASGDNIMPV
jgi:hypothetical protein